MDKLKRYLPFFLASLLAYLAAEAAHYIFWGKFFFYLINSLLMSLYIVSWPFSRVHSASNRNFGYDRGAIAAVMLFWFFCKCAKDRFLMESDALSRHCWYAYYVAIILLPLLCYEFSLQFGSFSDGAFRKRVWPLRIVSAGLIAAIVTNDLHQAAFSFPEGIAAWADSYSRGPLYFGAVAFGTILFVIAIVRIFRQCTLPKSKQYIWLLILPLGVGLGYIVLYFFDLDLRINNIRVFGLADTFCFLVMVFIDACEVIYQIATGLPDEESLMLHRIWVEVESRMDQAEQYIHDAEGLADGDYKARLFYAGFLQTYAKRVSNLMLLEEQKGKLGFAELTLSLAESVEFLKLGDVEAMLVPEGKKQYTASELLAVYREFEDRLEPILPELGAVLVAVKAERKGIRLRIQAEDREGEAL